jgi:hypothetical protein
MRHRVPDRPRARPLPRARTLPEWRPAPRHWCLGQFLAGGVCPCGGPLAELWYGTVCVGQIWPEGRVLARRRFGRLGERGRVLVYLAFRAPAEVAADRLRHICHVQTEHLLDLLGRDVRRGRVVRRRHADPQYGVVFYRFGAPR